MNKFKAGDRVEYINVWQPCRRYLGELATVVKQYNYDIYSIVEVRFDNGDEHRFDAQNFKLIEENPTEDTQKIVDIAKGLVYGDRGEAYGHPAEDYARVALIWSGILGVDITPVQAIQCMVGIKLSRLSNTPDHRDSWVDIAGYAECGDRINRYQAGDKDS